jgi:hypothetical protein
MKLVMRYLKFIFIICLANIHPAIAQEMGYTLKSHSLIIAGTSTMHDWTMSSGKAEGHASLDIKGTELKNIKSLLISVDGMELKSDKQSKSMDKKAHEALRTAEYPNIIINFKTLTALPSEQNGSILTAMASLNIGGVSKDQSLNIKTKISNDGSITFQGEQNLLMSDFKIKPPKAMMGMLTTGNEIKISYEFTLSKN